jgi:hypothetical protein
MPFIICEATSFLLHQQHQLALTTCTRGFFNLLIPTIINDASSISDRILFFYLQKIPPYTICYVNKIRVHVQSGLYSMNMIMNQHNKQSISDALSRINPEIKTVAAPVDLLHLMVHGQLRHLSFFGTSADFSGSFESFFTSFSSSRSNPLLSFSSLSKSVVDHRVGIKELRFSSLRFSSAFDFGTIVSLLADQRATTRRSLEVLEFSACSFENSLASNNSPAAQLHESEDAGRSWRERACFLPGMKSSDEMLNLSGLLELNVSEIPFYKSAQPSVNGFFCFELLPPNLQKLKLAKFERSSFQLHPAYDTLDWENMPRNLIELNLNQAETCLLLQQTKASSSEAESPNVLKRIKFEHFTRHLQILHLNQSAFEGPLQFSNNHLNLREILLSSSTRICGPIDFTALPPSLEVFSAVRCVELGVKEKIKRQTEGNDGKEKELITYCKVDFTQLPRNLKCLRLDWCGLKNISEKEERYYSLDLTKLPSTLEILSLSQNSLGGKLDLSRLPSCMTTLNLNFNDFEGEINLRHLPASMIFVDVSHNPKISGSRMKKEDVESIRNNTSKLKVLGVGL